MASYKIHRWDPVLVKNNNMPYPMIYIKPDKVFNDFAVQNSYAVLVKIEGTDTIYDGKYIVGTVGSLECNRPHMMNKTGLCTITLYAQWHIYPEKLGNAIISGMKGSTPYIPVTHQPGKQEEMYQRVERRSPTCENNLNTAQIGSIAIGILVLFGVLSWISHTTKKSV